MNELTPYIIKELNLAEVNEAARDAITRQVVELTYNRILLQIGQTLDEQSQIELSELDTSDPEKVYSELANKLNMHGINFDELFKEHLNDTIKEIKSDRDKIKNNI